VVLRSRRVIVRVVGSIDVLPVHFEKRRVTRGEEKAQVSPEGKDVPGLALGMYSVESAKQSIQSSSFPSYSGSPETSGIEMITFQSQ
jgi:hypothetical protein